MNFLYVEEEFDDIAVLHNIFFAFALHKAFFFCCVPGTKSDKVVVFDDFCADESFFKVGMDCAGSFGSFGAFFDGPGATFLFAGGVMSNSIIKNELSNLPNVYFTEPQYSADNAVGVALICREKFLKGLN